MTSVSDFVVNYIVNATWQIAAIAIVAAAGAFLLRNAPARYRHVLWLAVLFLCAFVPLLTASRHTFTEKSVVEFEKEPVTVSASVNSEPETSVSHLTTRRTRVVNASFSTVSWLILVYALFITWRLIRLLRFWIRKERLRRSAINTDLPDGVEQVAQRCRAMLQVPNVRIARSSTVRVPYTLGARRPLIVLPAAFCSADDEQLVSVIGHELAHVARHDYVTNLLRELVALPISFHPLTFLINRQIDRARELACDELVTKRLLPPKQYARSLVWAADVASQARSQALLLSMFDSSSLEERIMRLTRNRKMLSRPLARVLMWTTLCLLCATAISLSLFSFELKTQARAVVTATAPRMDDVNTRGADTSDSGANAVGASSVAGATVAAPQTRRETPGAAESAQQRAEAACEAGRSGDTEKIPALIAMLGDDTRTELIRCWSVGRWSPALDTFKNPSPGEQAAIALASMGRAAFLPLTSQLDSSNGTVRRNAAWAIGELTNMPPGERDGAVPKLVTLLTDADEWVRMAAARALGEVHNRSAVPALVSTLSDADGHVRELAVWALSELKDKRAVAALCSVLLSDARPEVRRGAAEALGEIASAEALPSLKQALNDPAISAKVQWAISEIEG
ncbi:MAG: M56 family metallopeptidase [Acidobacteria bacterium]|nr:M56 family metallopeptidase [Acidobacteriota bacterium]